MRIVNLANKTKSIPLCFVQGTPCSIHLIVATCRARHLDLEAEPSHAAAVQVYCRLAVLLGVGGVRKEHALVAAGLLVLAHAAGLSGCHVS